MASGAENLSAFETALEQRDIKYMELAGSPQPAVRIGYSTETLSRLDVFFWFDDDGQSTHFASGVIAHVPEHKRDKALEVINAANMRYRWVSFFLDGDSDILARGDQVLMPDTIGDTCHELMMRTLAICDDASADFMRAIWGE